MKEESRDLVVNLQKCDIVVIKSYHHAHFLIHNHGKSMRPPRIAPAMD